MQRAECSVVRTPRAHLYITAVQIKTSELCSHWGVGLPGWALVSVGHVLGPCLPQWGKPQKEWFTLCGGKSCAFFLNLFAVCGSFTHVTEIHAAKTSQTWLVLVPNSASLLVQYVWMSYSYSWLQCYCSRIRENVWDSALPFVAVISVLWRAAVSLWVCWWWWQTRWRGRDACYVIWSLLASCTPASSAGAGQCVRHGGVAARDGEKWPLHLPTRKAIFVELCDELWCLPALRYI